MDRSGTAKLLARLRRERADASALAAGKLPPSRRAARRAGRLLLLLAAAGLLAVAFPPFLLPLDGVQTSGYFFRRAPDSSRLLALEFHDGLDLAAPRGARVRPSAPGRVVSTGSGPVGGNFVTIRHPFGFETYYAHLDRIDLREGRLVLFPAAVGLGAVGATGRATGPHLHFELRFLGRSLPPRPFLAPHALRLALLGF